MDDCECPLVTDEVADEYFVNLREKKEEKRQSRRRESEWSGLWFVNVGMESADANPVQPDGKLYVLHWKHCVTFGYVAAGWGHRALQRESDRHR